MKTKCDVMIMVESGDHDGEAMFADAGNYGPTVGATNEDVQVIMAEMKYDVDSIVWLGENATEDMFD